MKFTEWFEKKLIVGMFPITQNEHFEASNFDVVINVSDEFYLGNSEEIMKEGKLNYYFPMGESGESMGLNSIIRFVLFIRMYRPRQKRITKA